MPAIAIATIVAQNYLSHARVLANSVHRFHPEIPVYALIADMFEPDAAEMREPFRPLTLADIHPSGLPASMENYTSKQVLAASKARLMRHLLGAGHDSVVYMDADILVLAELDPLLLRAAKHSLSISPHFGPPRPGPGRFKREVELLTRGMFNGGFVAAANRAEALAFLDWWDARLQTHCEDHVREGFHFDQRWLDLAPAYIDDLHVIHDPGCNVAYWNLPDLDVAPGAGPGEFQVNGAPCRFFHFSGFDPRFPAQMASYQPSLQPADFPAMAPLYAHYASLLAAQGFAATIEKPWQR